MAVIREYSSDDAESGRELWCQLVDRHRVIYESESIGGANPGGQFDRFLRNPRLAGVWVAEEQDQIVGLVGLLMGQDGDAEVEPLVVRADRRSMGIGIQLIERVKQEAIHRGVRSLTAKPVARNIDAMKFFHNAGFTTLGQMELALSLVPDETAWKKGVVIHGQDYRY